jgi:hypothetical protein
MGLTRISQSSAVSGSAFTVVARTKSCTSPISTWQTASMRAYGVARMDSQCRLLAGPASSHTTRPFPTTRAPRPPCPLRTARATTPRACRSSPRIRRACSPRHPDRLSSARVARKAVEDAAGCTRASRWTYQHGRCDESWPTNDLTLDQRSIERQWEVDERRLQASKHDASTTAHVFSV